MRIWIKHPLAIFAHGADGGIVVDGAEIVECVPSGATATAPVHKVFDASQHVILPGLINTHHHFYQTLTRCRPEALNKELFGWLKALYPIWSNLTPESIHVSTQLALAELLLSGCTTSVDHHYVFPANLHDAIDIQAEAARSMGMRVCLTRGSMNLSVEDGGLPPKSVIQDTDAILSDSERVIDSYHDGADGSHCCIALAPCSPFSVTRDVMEQSAALADRMDVRLHTHLAETEDENSFCKRKFKCRPLDYLEQVGWLSNRTWLAHGIHFTTREIQRLGGEGVGISHCPASNMILASGLCPGIELESAGCAVGIGVDGSASNDASNLVQEVRHALQIQRLRYGSASVSHMDVIRWATEGSAACIGRSDIGSIAVGKQADLAMFKLDELRFSGASDPLAALVLCGAHRADRVMIGGRWRVIDGEISDLSVNELRARHHHEAHSLTCR